MRKVIGTILGIAAMMLCVVVPILMLAGISGMIWGGRVFSGPQPKSDPATTFAAVSMLLAISIGVYCTFCLISLPIFASFGVRIVSKRQTKPDSTVALARMMRTLALRYASLMDKLVEQQGPNQAMERTADRGTLHSPLLR